MRFHSVSVAAAIATVTIFASFTSPTLAQQGQQLTAQQEKMKTCNADANAKGLKGDARKSFMSDCLKAKPAAATNKQQEKMKACNTQATAQQLKGQDRQKFMSSCLKAS